MLEALTTVEAACSAAGFVFESADPKVRAVIGCGYIKGRAAPTGLEPLWVDALAACDVVEGFLGS